MSDYFVKVQDGKTLRRGILEASKGSINILRSYHTLIDIRAEKLALIEQLRHELKDLSLMVNMFSDMMPVLTKSDVKAVENLEKLPKRRYAKGEKHVFFGNPEKEIEVAKEEFSDEPAEEVEEEKDKTQQLHEKLATIERKLKKL